MSTTVRIYWSREQDNVTQWHEVCAWAIKYFGGPGDRFQTSANVNYMDFVFNDNKDALIMSLRWSAKIIDDNQLTFEFVGSKLQ